MAVQPLFSHTPPICVHDHRVPTNVTNPCTKETVVINVTSPPAPRASLRLIELGLWPSNVQLSSRLAATAPSPRRIDRAMVLLIYETSKNKKAFHAPNPGS